VNQKFIGSGYRVIGDQRWQFFAHRQAGLGSKTQPVGPCGQTVRSSNKQIILQSFDIIDHKFNTVIFLSSKLQINPKLP